MNEPDKPDATAQDTETLVDQNCEPHSNHCFVVMPYGSTTEEERWFKGWYKMVILPGVKEAGYDPILSAAEEQPGAINDEIRAHLAYDSMVVVDLGGCERDEPPNPNVMYELGIRHAFGLPLVMMAWKGQTLPFDVSNQRVIMEDRDLLATETNRKKLVSFLVAAREGKYYRPMEAVGRQAVIDRASATLGDESVLGALAYEVRNLRKIVFGVSSRGRRLRPVQRAPNLKSLMRKKKVRKPLYAAFENAGGTTQQWARILKTVPADSDVKAIATWGIEEWVDYIGQQAEGLGFLAPGSSLETPELEDDSPMAAEQEGGKEDQLEPETLERVKNALPRQPWPQGVHQEVARKLGLSARVVYRAISTMIRSGELLPQINGVVYTPLEDKEEHCQE